MSPGTAVRTEDCQVEVSLAYASPLGHAPIDRELHVPQSWTEDTERCRAADIPEEAEFTTKPWQAQVMIPARSPPGNPDSRGGAHAAWTSARYALVPQWPHYCTVSWSADI